ncbi:DUF177 domain-containing protein [Chloroflexota bacterium]
MLINVSQQLKSEIGTIRKYELSETVNVNGGAGLVRGEITMVRTNRSILIKGGLDAEIEFKCGRCLNLFQCHLPLEIEEEYFPVADVDSGAPLAEPDEPGSFTIDEYHIIDLDEVLRQYTLIAAPMKPLCSEDCAGLCFRCGHNLNQGACQCLSQEIDSRWSALEKLALTDDIGINE